MTIKFICSCGKHLRARDEMASRRSVCPRCGSPVGIPALKPTHPGGGAPLTPLERQRLARSRAAPPSEPAAPAPASPGQLLQPAVIDTSIVRLLSSRGKRPAPASSRHLEAHWYECLLYPLRAWHLCLGLAAIMTVLSTFVPFALRLLLAEAPGPPWLALLFRLPFVVLLVLIVGLPCSFLERVLASAVDGEVSYIRWSGNPLLTFLLSGARWSSCFLAGPVVFAVVGYLYWLNCGDPALVDYLILAEVGVVAVAYLVFALLSVTDRGWLRGLDPLAVIDLAHRLGWRALAGVLAASLVLLAPGWLLLAGLSLLHGEALVGFAVLLAGWAGGVFWTTFFCRLLGIWCHRARLAPDDPVTSPAAPAPS